MCPPGTRVAAHCSASKPTKCVPCGGEQYTELWNYLPRCLYCNTICYENQNQEVEMECSATNNRVCRCKEGFYSTDDFCYTHSECGPGQGVKTKGTSRTDTVCEACAEGFYSSSFSKLSGCAPHEGCALGEAVILNGSVHHDTVCGTCQDLTTGGETYRRVLSGVFSMQRMRITKMKKFISRIVHKRNVSMNTLPRNKGDLLDQIKVWLAEAPRDELMKLPERLRDTQFRSIPDKLDELLCEIARQNQDCNLEV